MTQFNLMCLEHNRPMTECCPLQVQVQCQVQTFPDPPLWTPGSLCVLALAIMSIIYLLWSVT